MIRVTCPDWTLVGCDTVVEAATDVELHELLTGHLDGQHPGWRDAPPVAHSRRLREFAS